MPKRNKAVRVAFDDWFVRNYQTLKNRISTSSELDEDAFHEAYLAVVTSKNKCEDITELRNTFLIAYSEHTKKHIHESYVVCHPDVLFFTLLPDTPEDETPKTNFSSLAIKVSKFIQATFTEMQIAIWQMRIQGISIVNTADSLGLKPVEVRQEYNQVLTRTQRRFALSL